MNENGRKADYLIEDETYTDLRTGVGVVNNLCFTVWADEKMKPLIKGVDGVTDVFNSLAKTKFSVYYDQRYDRETLKREIIAAIKNKMDEE